MGERTVSRELKFEDDEDEFRSCCADEDELLNDDTVKNDDEFSVKMFFKGVSIGFDLSGIGIVIESVNNNKVPLIQVQKKLEFFADELVAEYLALMDGLSEATRNDIKRVFAFTDSAILFDQITTEEPLENPLLMALKQRVLEQAQNLQHFVLKRVETIHLEEPLRLAQVAIGVIHFPIHGDKSVQNCLICCENKPQHMTITLKCSHAFCSACIKDYSQQKLQVPIKCPNLKCRYYISRPELKLFLPAAPYKLLESALLEQNSDKFYCPFPDCSVLLDPHCSDNDNCVECPVCRRFVCVKCGVTWHSSMSCDEFQEMDIAEVCDIRWKRCQMCERMIELTHGCYHMTCWCGHEFCYSCGAEYRDNQQICDCAFWDGDEEEGGENDEFTPTHNYDLSGAVEEWAWDSCGSLSNLMDAYSDQERSQLALIQRFLAGGFSLGDHHTYTYQAQPQPPPQPCTDSDDSSYLEDTIKDLHQLPWLERFVSVISDNYYDEYTR